MHAPSLLFPAAILLLAAACGDQPTAVPPASTAPAAAATVTCRGDARTRTLACCNAPDAAGPDRDVVTFGGQNRFVRLTSSGVAYDSATDVLRADVSAQNLLAEALGTADGVTPDARGVRVFFSSGPNATTPGGPVVVANATGTATFTAPQQAYFQYGGSAGAELGADGVLSSGETSDAKVWKFGMNGASSFTFTVYVQAPAVSAGAGFLHLVSVVAGSHHTCGLTNRGRAYCWGLNSSGQLGDGTSTSSSVPRAVQGGLSFLYLVAGGASTCGLRLRPPRTVYCWGDNSFGQLGDGTRTSRNTPTLIAMPDPQAEFSSLVAGYDQVCGLEGYFGTLYCWGRNDDGQLGDGTTTERLVPTAAREFDEFVSWVVGSAEITASSRHTCSIGVRPGVKTLYCWGAGSSGQLGDGTFAQHTVPSLVNGSVMFRTVAAGSGHTCAISEFTPVLYCWGDNSFGQLGNGTSGNVYGTLVEVPQPGRLPFSSVAAGEHFTCGIADVAYCWGRNSSGQLGIGSLDPRSVPTPVQSGIAFTSISAGGTHACGIPTSGPIYCWGDNSAGQLGDGTTQGRLSPTAVAGTQ